MKKINIVILVSIILITIIYFKEESIYGDDRVNNLGKNIVWITQKPIAHRGLHSRNIPENSMKSFENAVNKGYPIELDLRITKDKEVVVIHDNNLEVLTGIPKNIEDVTYNQISSIKLVNSQEFIPLFKNVLSKVDGRVPLLIEIKTNKNADVICNEVNNILKGYKGNYAIQSFDYDVIKWYSQNNPAVIKGLLINDINSQITSYVFNKIISNDKDKPDFLSVSINILNDNRFQVLREKGYIVISWTIKSENQKNRVKGLCDNYIFENINVS